MGTLEVAYLLLGSNLGDSQKYLEEAVKLLESNVGVVKEASSFYQTASWGKTDQPDFINQVICLQTAYKPQQLLEKILVIEQQLGRQRIEKWGSRTIDIDILFYGQQVIQEPNLIIPHPYLHQRRFTLMPLLEIAPDLLHPVLNKSIRELFETLDDKLSVKKI
ncbi:MAG TPA: 2-amino-4-hydroxy-6-hydroxymethyldihydropteridine diphosphokinase [Daejeonella sp.]|nr:2-amino-4-hydroxy-6-hydroxymethyldihydropteridine diphosphokinase [Daejeonella sp.]